MKTTIGCMLFVSALIVIGCSVDRSTDSTTHVPQAAESVPHPDIVGPEIAGEFHNRFLDMTFEAKSAGARGSLTEVSGPVFKELFAGRQVSAEFIDRAIRESSRTMNDLIDTGLIRFPDAAIADPVALADRLVETGSFAAADRKELTAFLGDLALAAETGPVGYAALIDRWRQRDAGDGIAYAVDILEGSSAYWSGKHGQREDQEIVLADVVGGLVGFWFGGIGSIIGAGITSYMAAVECDNVGPH